MPIPLVPKLQLRHALGSEVALRRAGHDVSLVPKLQLGNAPVCEALLRRPGRPQTLHPAAGAGKQSFQDIGVTKLELGHEEDVAGCSDGCFLGSGGFSVASGVFSGGSGASSCGSGAASRYSGAASRGSGHAGTPRGCAGGAGAGDRGEKCAGLRLRSGGLSSGHVQSRQEPHDPRGVSRLRARRRNQT